MDSPRRPFKPRVPGDPSTPVSPGQMLREARKHRRQSSTDRMLFDTLSPSMVARLNELPIKTTFASALAAMKPGVAEAASGFRDVKLAGSPRSHGPAQTLKELLGSGCGNSDQFCQPGTRGLSGRIRAQPLANLGT